MRTGIQANNLWDSAFSEIACNHYPEGDSVTGLPNGAHSGSEWCEEWTVLDISYHLSSSLTPTPALLTSSIKCLTSFTLVQPYCTSLWAKTMKLFLPCDFLAQWCGKPMGPYLALMHAQPEMHCLSCNVK